MILDFMLSDGEFAMTEFGDLEDLALLMFGMMYLCLLSFWLLWFVIVCGGAVVIRRAHVHEAAMFTGTASILSHTSSPALAITGGCSIRVLQGFVFEHGIGVRGEAPDPDDLFGHFRGGPWLASSALIRTCSGSSPSSSPATWAWIRAWAAWVAPKATSIWWGALHSPQLRAEPIS